MIVSILKSLHLHLIEHVVSEDVID